MARIGCPETSVTTLHPTPEMSEGFNYTTAEAQNLAGGDATEKLVMRNFIICTITSILLE